MGEQALCAGAGNSDRHRPGDHCFQAHRDQWSASRRSQASDSDLARHRHDRCAHDRGGDAPAVSWRSYSGSATAARRRRLGSGTATDAGGVGCPLRARWSGYRRLRNRAEMDSSGSPVRSGGDLRRRDGGVHDDHGQRVRRVSGDDGWDRAAADRAEVRRRSSNHGGDRDAVRVLRNLDDADGSELQHRADGTPGAARRERRDQSPNPDGTLAAWREHPVDELSGIPPLSDMVLTPAVASGFARLTLSHVTREYPNKLDHVIGKRADLKSPRRLHPVFFGSFDWHSCVHGYWLLATLLRLYPDLEEAAEIARLLDAQLTATKVTGELRYLERKSAGTFERPYGWAWLLMLAAELKRHVGKKAAKWNDALNPLAGAFRERLWVFLPKATYPIRVGTHFNS